jgi:hypothetical protein
MSHSDDDVADSTSSYDCSGWDEPRHFDAYLAAVQPVELRLHGR